MLAATGDPSVEKVWMKRQLEVLSNHGCCLSITSIQLYTNAAS